MAIAPTPSILKKLTFDGESSADYGVQILGEGVFNAPEREVEMISIPGRNGAFALDKGRFENIPVTYPASLIANNTEDFADAISNFRNMLCSRKGYVRLTDDYHPDEYRLAVYKSGLDVDERVLRAGEFEIEFDCMPQRWLLSGEEKITVADGDTVTNPTLFESKPLIEANGYGDISFNGASIKIENVTVGTVLVAAAQVSDQPFSITFDDSLLNAGDTIKVSGVSLTQNATITAGYTKVKKDPYNPLEVTNGSGSVNSNGTSYSITLSDTTFAYGTSGAFNGELGIGIDYTHGGQNYGGYSSVELGVRYDGAHTLTIGTGGYLADCYTETTATYTISEVYADSSKSALTAPVYIDLDLGVAYGYIDGSIVSLNNAVNMPTKLPELLPGDNMFSYDNTITELKIVPRWWKV